MIMPTKNAKNLSSAPILRRVSRSFRKEVSWVLNRFMQRSGKQKTGVTVKGQECFCVRQGGTSYPTRASCGSMYRCAVLPDVAGVELRDVLGLLECL